MPGSIGDSAATAGLKAVRVGIVAGFFTCLAYPLVVFVPLPKLATTALAACLGPALGVASLGLRRLLDLERPLVSSALGLLLNALAGGVPSLGHGVTPLQRDTAAQLDPQTIPWPHSRSYQ